jgi:hypothetical protein
MPGILDESGNAWHKEEERRRQMMEGVEILHLCIPFQCKLCWFRNIKGRDHVPGRDDNSMTCIRQANLDAMLGKSPLTIRSHRRETLAALRNEDSIGKTLAYHPRGPFPLGDYVGMNLAVDMLVKSLIAKGRILDHIHFSTLRKMRSTYTKNWESLPYGVIEGAAFANGKYRVRQTSCPAQSEWFHDFLRGLKFRMGCQSNSNHGLLIGAIVHLLALMRADVEEAKEAGSMSEADELWKVGAFYEVTRGSTWSLPDFASISPREGLGLSPQVSARALYSLKRCAGIYRTLPYASLGISRENLELTTTCSP